MDSFNRKFGEQLDDGSYEVPARWQSGYVPILTFTAGARG